MLALCSVQDLDSVRERVDVFALLLPLVLSLQLLTQRILQELIARPTSEDADKLCWVLFPRLYHLERVQDVEDLVLLLRALAFGVQAVEETCALVLLDLH